MQRFLAEGEALQQVGVMGLRAPDGSIMKMCHYFASYPRRR